MTLQQELNQPNQTPEHLSDERLFDLVNGVGNHEAKLLTAAIVTSVPDDAFSSKRIENALVTGQGSEPAWTPDHKLGFKYGIGSLEPIGAVVKTTTEGRLGVVDALQATEFGATYGLPFSGALLDWSLRYPDLSLQKLLGKTGTTGTVRSPQMRYLIYSELLTTDDGAAMTDVVASLESYGLDYHSIHGQIDDMEKLGLVHVDSQRKSYNPRIEISNPAYEHVAINFTDIRPEMQLIYKTIGTLYGTGSREVTLDALIKECQDLSPDVDPTILRTILVHGIRENSTGFGSRLKIHEDDVAEDPTGITLKSELAKPVMDLCQRIENIRDGKNLDEYSLRAKEIIASKDDFKKLMAKAQTSSFSVKAQAEGGAGFRDRLEGLVKSMGAVSVRQLAEHLEANGETYHIESVRLALNSLVKQGRLDTGERKISNSKKAVIKVYSLSIASGNQKTAP